MEFIMSLLSIVSPVELLSAVQSLTAIAIDAAPLLGFGALIAALMVFKWQLLGEESQNNTMHDVLALNQMARELDAIEPNLAAELRYRSLHCGAAREKI